MSVIEGVTKQSGGEAMAMKIYPCSKSATGTCQYGGHKAQRNFIGLVSNEFCRHPRMKCFIDGLLGEKDCPLKEKLTNGDMDDNEKAVD